MRRRIGILLLCLLFVISGCSQPAAPTTPATPPTPSTPSTPSTPTAPPPPTAPTPATTPASPTTPPASVTVTPRLILDLALGDHPEQPGRFPERVGGISPRGPLALAVEWGALYLADAAKLLIRQYDMNGVQSGSIPAPWLDDQWVDLKVSPFGLDVTLPRFEYTLGRWDGFFFTVKQRPSVGATGSVDEGKGPWLIGQDRQGSRYQRALGSKGLVAQRVSKEGAVLAEARVEAIGEVHDWYVSRDGGLYALTYRWGQGEIDRAQVWEVLGQVNFSNAPGGFDPIPGPELLGHPMPTSMRLRFDDWAPVAVPDGVAIWNIWTLLASAVPATEPEPGPDYWGFTIEATLPDGSTLPLKVRHDNLWLDGKRYQFPFYEGLNSVIHRLRFSEEGVKGALSAATSLRLAIPDLPGVERPLTPAEREQLIRSLTGAIPASSGAGPHPLEPPFPQYAILLEGEGWQGSILLRGDRYIQKANGGAAVHSGELSRLVKGWLPVPELKPADVAYLYLADRLEIGQGGDLTRWKNNVVRRLINARVAPGYQPLRGAPESLTLTFRVKGEKLTVQVESEGFTYQGKRYPGSGLLEIFYLQGVP